MVPRSIPSIESHNLAIPSGTSVILKVKRLEEKYEAKLEFTWGRGGGIIIHDYFIL